MLLLWNNQGERDSHQSQTDNYTMAQRSRALAALRELHRVKREVFDGDAHAIEVVTQRIREEFRKNIAETDPSKIEESLNTAEDVAKLLRTSVVQLRQKDDETLELRLTKNTELPKNTLYDPTKEIIVNPRRRKCSDTDSGS